MIFGAMVLVSRDQWLDWLRAQFDFCLPRFGIIKLCKLNFISTLNASS